MLDFSKPLRIVGRMSGDLGAVETIKEGVTIVRDEDGSIFVVDEHGTVQTTEAWTGDGGLRVENVPEEPKDHVLLYRYLGDDTWRIDRAGPGTKTEYERLATGHSGAYRNVMAVKVPV